MLRWNEVQPVLEATYELIETRGNNPVDGTEVAEKLGLDSGDLRLVGVFRALRDAEYVTAYFSAGPMPPRLIQATEKGLQATRGWPRPGELPDTKLLLELMDQRIADPDMPEEDRT